MGLDLDFQAYSIHVLNFHGTSHESSMEIESVASQIIK